jgi:ankyrin repeat protein
MEYSIDLYLRRHNFVMSLAIRLTFLSALLLSLPLAAFSRKLDSDQCATPLIRAIRSREMKEVQRLIKSGLNVDEKACAEGNTALFEAIGGGQTEIATQLIDAGADPNKTDAIGSSPLMSAAWNCHLGVAVLLIQRHAKVNAVDENGYTPLMYGSSYCDDGKIVALLLRAGSAINSKTNHGDTALTTAAFFGNETAVIELVAAGADVNIHTSEGTTALSIAKGRDVGRKPSHDRIYAFLKDFSVQPPTNK